MTPSRLSHPRDTSRYAGRLSSVCAIARLTLREALRKRVLLIVGLFILLVIATMPFFGMGRLDAIQLVERVSLAAMTFLGLIPILLIAATGIPAEIESKRIYSITSKPVSRLSYLMGRVIGIALLGALMLSVMSTFTIVVIRLLALKPTVTVTARQSHAMRDGLVLTTLSEGQTLACMGEDAENYTVSLPENQGVTVARISRDEVDVDQEKDVATVTAETGKLMHNGQVLAEVRKGKQFLVAEMGLKDCVVHLPEDLQEWTGTIARETASEPRGTTIAAERVITPASQVFFSVGRWECDADTGRIHLSATRLIEGEIWCYRDIVGQDISLPTDQQPGKSAPQAPADDTVRGWFHCKGLFGHKPAREQDGIDKATLNLELSNPVTGQVWPVITPAKRILGELVAEISFPKELLADGLLNVRIAETDPPTSFDMMVLISPRNRVARWHFEGLNDWPLEEQVRVRLFFVVRFQGLPGSVRPALVPVKVISPATDKVLVVHEVMLHNEVPLTFEFDRSLIDTDGSVDIVIDYVKDDFRLQIQPDKVPVYLLAHPRLFEFSFLKAVLLVYMQLLLVAMCATMWSSIVSGYVAALATVVFYMWGIGSEFISNVLQSGEMLGGTMASARSAAQNPFLVRSIFEFVQTNIMWIMIHFFPNLAKFTGTRYVLDRFDVPLALVMNCLATTLFYGGVFFVLAWIFFRRREFR